MDSIGEKLTKGKNWTYFSFRYIYGTLEICGLLKISLSPFSRCYNANILRDRITDKTIAIISGEKQYSFSRLSIYHTALKR